MGNCCASGGREGAFDQKEDKLTNPELKKEDDVVGEKGVKPAVQSPDDISFKEMATQIKSHNDNTNVSLYESKTLENY